MQKILIFLLLISLNLFADNPKVYTQLGDGIYENIENIKALKELDSYKQFENKIDTYVTRVKKMKVLGFSVEDGSRSNLKLDYLGQLRKLSKVNNYFKRAVQSSFESALKTKNSKLFIDIVNSDLLDTKKYKKKIMYYYDAHKNEIDATGVIQDFIDEAYAKKHKKRYKPKTKKKLHEEKVKRLRANDKLKEIALEDKLAKELKAKKEKIRKDQERELFN